MKLAYTDYAKYYDLIFSRKDYPQESAFIKKKVIEITPNAKSILDVGCGTGEHLNILKDEFDILWGTDINKEIIDVAKSKSGKIKYRVAGMKDFQLNVKFDVVTCLYSVFNYNLTTDDALYTLQSFKNHLNPNGLVIIALYNPSNTDKVVSLHLGSDKNIEVAKINQYTFNPETKTETTDFLLLLKTPKGLDFKVEKDHKYRIFGFEEFEGLCKQVGFEKVDFFDHFQDMPATENTKYPVAVIR